MNRGEDGLVINKLVFQQLCVVATCTDVEVTRALIVLRGGIGGVTLFV